MIRVLIVDDSPVVREHLTGVLSSQADVQVIGTARDGQEAIELARRNKPDVITMDVNMPKVNGIDATRIIMETCPVPIVIVSAQLNSEAVATTLRAMEAGAVAVMETPPGPAHPNYNRLVGELVQTVRVMSEVKVVRRWSQSKLNQLGSLVFGATALQPEMRRVKLIAIGASIGGPPVIGSRPGKVKRYFPIPGGICQHKAPGFVEGLASWLQESTGFQVRLPMDGEALLPGFAYIAPDGFQMGVRSGDRISLSKGDPENGLRPAVSYLFRSVAHSYGASAVGVLLTGMGRDGAEELRLMRDRGALTIAQDAETSTVHGMPGEAMKLNAASHVLPPKAIAEMLNSLAKNK